MKAIFDPCVKFLENQPKTKSNVMKILTLAELYKLDKVREDCDDLLKDMTLKSTLEIVDLQDLGRDKLQHLLTQRIERLETFLDELYPQFMGLVDWCIWLYFKAKIKPMNWCPEHFRDGKAGSDIDERIIECEVCKEMLLTMTNYKSTLGTSFGGGMDINSGDLFGSRKTYRCGGSLRLNNRLPDVIQEFVKLMRH